MKIDDDLKIRNVLAKRITDALADFEVIKGIQSDITDGSLTQTMTNLQSYENLKKMYLQELNEIHLEAVQLLTRTQYLKFQTMIRTIKEKL